MSFAFPERTPARPAWLVTLADLALLLVGFFVLLQAHQLDRGALASGIRQGFAGNAAALAGPAAPAAGPTPIATAAAALDGFAPGTAAPPAPTAAAVAWARDAAADPRTAITVTGYTDGSAADVDGASGSAAVLAADRARTLAAALAAAGVAPGRTAIATAVAPGRRAAIATVAFTGNRP